MCADIEWIRHSQKYMDIMRGIQGAESIEEVWIDSACYLKAWEQKFWYVPNFLYGMYIAENYILSDSYKNILMVKRIQHDWKTFSLKALENDFENDF